MELNKIYNMDCTEYMKTLTDGCVDLIIADPPYNINIDKWDTFESKEKYLTWCETWINECSRILSKSGTLYCYSSQEFATDIELIIKNSLNFKKRIIWYRPDTQRQNKIIYNYNYEPILYFTKTDNYTFNNNMIQIESKYGGSKHKRYDKDGNPFWKEINPTKQCGDVWEICKVKGGSKQDTKHKSQKPLELCNRIIKASSNENDIVYIPFAGSGSEVVSCIDCNRKWIATEINQDYIEDIINKRIESIKVS